ncbi:sulfatase [Coraliomargarita algicola]|uniref:Sulfatase n=1 Tax=Coraliomargarita algicola TaxID=3092156 RepID=A0ABZ0RLW8_9BACT|nr:sulfatase [Coraliomargarita sp. J2-16]WPJ96438.1 sulfatase [Coraliomargarita sp. J2-16]
MKAYTLAAFMCLCMVSLEAAPNIVFILVDDMAWTGTSTPMAPSILNSKSDFYLTPHIDGLASSGIRFSQAYAPAALCTPSRAAILTGKTPAELHMTTPGGGRRAQSFQQLKAPQHIKELPESALTIAELLQQQGYATAHFGKWHLGQKSPSLHGFDVHDGSTHNMVPASQQGPKDVFGLTQRAIAFMTEQAATKRAFYLQLSHYAVHSPVEALDSSKAKFSQIKTGSRHNEIEYAAMTYDLDTSIGQLLQEIDALGLSNNTYVVFMSDNGASSKPRESLNTPLRAGKGTLYEGGIRVPLIIRGPGVPENRVCHEPVTGCDLLATFCDWAGIFTTTETDGSSLAALASADTSSFNRAQNVFLFHYPHYGKGPRQKPQTAIIIDQFKLLKDLESDSYQLFDLSNDISESKDLLLQMPEKTASMKRLMQQRLLEVDAQQASINPNYNPKAEQTRESNQAGFLRFKK